MVVGSSGERIMRETIREIDIEPKAAMNLPAFAGGDADHRSVSRFFNADLVANSRAPPWPARSRHGGQYDIELGQGACTFSAAAQSSHQQRIFVV